MTRQQEISLHFNQGMRGKTIPVLVEGNLSDFRETGDAGIKSWLKECRSYGRAIFDAPQIDGGVLIKGEAEPGDIIKARVTDCSYYDLLAVFKKKEVS